MNREQLDIPPDSSYPFHVLATKYTDPLAEPESPDGLTLILTHSLGVHAETWEITVARLFVLNSKGSRTVKLKQIISIESPNHGRSAEVNAEAIARHSANDCTREYANAVQRFLVWLSAKTQPGSALNLIGISHSVGAPALFIAADALPEMPFQAMITFEPGMTSKDSPHRHRSNQAAIAWAWLRPDVWRSRKAAKKELSASPMYTTWDPRVFDLFLKHGLIDHPASKDKAPFTFPGVITALSREHHARSFHSPDLVVDGKLFYANITRRMPVHIVWGSIHELANQELKDFMADGKAGRTPASVSYIEGASHMIIQQKPEEAADLIHSLLLRNSGRMSRL
ncbi:Alpha/beta hydrolase fold-1 [Mycena filopes]|nr:Alpha/beta hydrolase fold-1 [Mycena filopes]